VKTYTITEAQFESIMRLDDAARLLAAALPPAYTRTPIGSLQEITDALVWLVMIQPNPEPVS
jgi:hypothetical protein